MPKTQLFILLSFAAIALGSTHNCGPHGVPAPAPKMCQCYWGWYSEDDGPEAPNATFCDVSLKSAYPVVFGITKYAFLAVYVCLTSSSLAIFIKLCGKGNSDFKGSITPKRCRVFFVLLTSALTMIYLIDPMAQNGVFSDKTSFFIFGAIILSLLLVFTATYWHWAHLYYHSHDVSSQSQQETAFRSSGPVSIDNATAIKIQKILRWFFAADAIAIILFGVTAGLVGADDGDRGQFHPAVICFIAYMSIIFSIWTFGFLAYGPASVAKIPLKSRPKYKLWRASRSIGIQGVIFSATWLFSLLIYFTLTEEPGFLIFSMWMLRGAMAFMLGQQISSFFQRVHKVPGFQWKGGRTISPTVDDV